MKEFDPADYFPSGPLCDVCGITKGDIPDELLPQNTADWAAISMLKQCFWNITDEAVAANTGRLKQRLPLDRLCFVLARDAYPYIRKASEGSAAPSKDPHAEIVALGNKIAFNLTAPSEGGAPGECVDGVYRGLSLSQLWLIHLWPYHPMVDDPDLTALPQKVLEWFDGVFLAVAVSVHARRILETFAPHARPTLALDWLLGRTANHDWYLASEMRLRTIAGDVEMMEFLTTTLGGPANSCT